MARLLLDVDRFDTHMSRKDANDWVEWVMSIPQDARASKHFLEVYHDHRLRGYEMVPETAKSIEAEVIRRTGPVYSFHR